MTLCPGEITCYSADPVRSGVRVSCMGLTLLWLSLEDADMSSSLGEGEALLGRRERKVGKAARM